MPLSFVDYTFLPHSLADQISAHGPVEQSQFVAPTTLVISDDPDLRILLIQCLHTLSDTAIGAAHGQPALATLERWPIRRVILDIPLSTRTPITTCAEIRDRAYDTEIVVLRSSPEQTAQKQAELRGADVYIQKPFRLAELQSVFQSLRARGHRVKLSIVANSNGMTQDLQNMAIGEP